MSVKVKSARDITMLLDDTKDALRLLVAEAEDMKDAARSIYDQAVEQFGERSVGAIAGFELKHHLEWMLRSLEIASSRAGIAQSAIESSVELRAVRR